MTTQHDNFIWEAKKTIEINKNKELLKDFTNEEIDNKNIKSLINKTKEYTNV